MPAKAGIQKVCAIFLDSRLRWNDKTGFVQAKSLNLKINQPVSIFEKCGMVPNRLVQMEPYEPPEENIVVDVLDESPLTTNRV